MWFTDCDSRNSLAGKTYRFRISNVGLTTSVNFRIQGHKMILVEVEGTHTLQNTYDSLDIHLGQSYSVLVTADQPPQDYFITASTRFTSPVLTSTSVLHYSNSAGSVSGPPPGGPTTEVDWSLSQARSIRWAAYCIAKILLYFYSSSDQSAKRLIVCVCAYVHAHAAARWIRLV